MPVYLHKDRQTVAASDAQACRIIAPGHGTVVVTAVHAVTPGRVELTYRTTAGRTYARVFPARTVFQRAYGDWTV